MSRVDQIPYEIDGIIGPIISIPFTAATNPYQYVQAEFLENLRNPCEMIINHVIDAASLLLVQYGINAFCTNPTPLAPQRIADCGSTSRPDR